MSRIRNLRRRSSRNEPAAGAANAQSARGFFTGASAPSRSFEGFVVLAAVAAAAGLYLTPPLVARGALPTVAAGAPAGVAALLIAATIAVALGGIYHLPLGRKVFLALGSGASFAILLSFPVHLALIPTTAGTVVAQFVSRRRRRLSAPAIIFNVAQYVVTWSLVIILFHRLWADLGSLPAQARLSLAAIGAGLVHMLVNTWLVSTWSALRRRTGAFELWLQILRESSAGYAVTLLLGAVAGLLATIHPFWVIPLLISVLVIFWGQTRMLGRQRRQITTILSSLVETNEGLSPFMHEQSERVAWWAERLARRMGLSESEIELVWLAAKLHDLGMMLLRRDLEATPDVLSDAQEALIKRHPALGAAVIERLPGMGRVAQCVRSHHEDYDGRGYPDGLKDDRIPVGARIIRVVDSYDDLCSARPHRPAFTPEGALTRIQARAGRDYDPKIVQALGQIIATTDAVPLFVKLFGASMRPQPALAAAPAGNPAWEAWKSRLPVGGGTSAPLSDDEETRSVDAPAQATPSLSEAIPYLVAIQETERRRIGRELHDEIGQALTGLKLTLDALPVQAERRVEESLQNARDVVSDLMMRVHDISLQLRPAVLDDLGLLPALQWHVERYQAQTGVGVAFTQSGLNRRFGAGVETAAYRIAQEALTNVARHAGVSEVTLRVWAVGGAVSVEVEDGGRGFDPGRVESNGLVGMKERALLVGGRLTVETGRGAGTRITATLPTTTAEVP